MTLATRDRDELEQPLQYEIDPELQRELLLHAGRWAMITRSELIALGNSPAEVMKKAEKSARVGMLYRIPDDSNTSFFF